ncbi:MAG: 16S rRNA (cytosine(1402)-N(4))-methyltransferase RsmH [Prevotella sp.]|nr:16S rRNA (cytosine(1402)-N(4))-methyltransferase RsmH [Prevotella sp.]
MDINASTYHTPVLLQESIDGLDIDPAGTYVDVTFGGGGHSREILTRLGPQGRLFGFDQDSDAQANIPADERFTFVQSNFRYLGNWMRYYGVEHIDGLLADLGVSSHHFDDGSRGFSFRQEGPLDMRMNKLARVSAADVVNGYDEKRLSDVLFFYGEVRNARRVAAAIVKARTAQPFTTTSQLAETLTRLFPREREKKEVTKVFQALRIEVNHEMDALGEMLASATQLLRSGGRLSVITYHSLEDRIVKNVMRSGNTNGTVEQDFFGRQQSPLRPIHNRVTTPGEEEQAANPRSRSAKLRIAEKI